MIAAHPPVDPYAQIAQLVLRTSALLEAAGRPDDAELLRANAAERQEPPTVVLAGEQGSGKSRLVNALLGVPDLSPVGDGGVTSAYISFSYADTLRACVRRAGDVRATAATEPAAVETIDPSSLADWATVRGNPGNRRNVGRIEVGVPAAILRDVTLIDTPGVGGLNSGHAALTLQALGYADALVFVKSAATQLSSRALEFLQRASERVEELQIVLTRRDDHHAWRDVRDRDMRLLEAYAPRFTGHEIIAVSARLAELGAARGAQWLDRADPSGSAIAELASRLRTRVADRAEQLRQARDAAACERAAASIELALGEQRAAARGDDAGRRLIAEAERELAGLGPGCSTWERQLERARGAMLELCEARLDAELRTLSEHYAARIPRVRESTAGTLVVDLRADLDALRSALGELAATVVGRELGALRGRARRPLAELRTLGELPPLVSVPFGDLWRSPRRLVLDAWPTAGPGTFVGGVIATLIGGGVLGAAALVTCAGVSIVLLQPDQARRLDRPAREVWLSNVVRGAREWLLDDLERRSAIACGEAIAAECARIDRRRAVLARRRAELEHASAGHAGRAGPVSGGLEAMLTESRELQRIARRLHGLVHAAGGPAA